MKYRSITVSLIVVIAACESIVEPPEDVNLKFNIAYRTPKGGDPRGTYFPNSPFLFTADPTDSLTVAGGAGTLTITGASQDSGEYTLELSSHVSGRISGIIYYNTKPHTDTTYGTWRVINNTLSVTDGNLVEMFRFHPTKRGCTLFITSSQVPRRSS